MYYEYEVNLNGTDAIISGLVYGEDYKEVLDKILDAYGEDKITRIEICKGE